MKMQNSDFSLKIEEVKCALSVLILSRCIGNRNVMCMVGIFSKNIRRNKFDKVLQHRDVADSDDLLKELKISF